MIRFDDNEFEIAIVTYNRPAFVKEWMDKCYESVKARNISLSIFDSSSNDETEELVKSLTGEGYEIKYARVCSETPIGYKPMLPILSSSSKYLWVCGDSRYHDFDDLDQKVFPYIKDDIDYILISVGFNDQNSGKIYSDRSELLRECFISTTCIGLSIYKLSLFAGLKADPHWMAECDRKYKENYGFGWLGYFFEAFAQGDHKAAFITIALHNIFLGSKKQAWAPRFYECWVENLCGIMDGIPESYTTKAVVPRETWTAMKLAGTHYSYVARMSGGLTPAIYEKYKQNGMLARVTDQEKKIRFFAYAPSWQVKLCYAPIRLRRKTMGAVRKMKKMLLPLVK